MCLICKTDVIYTPIGEALIYQKSQLTFKYYNKMCKNKMHVSSLQKCFERRYIDNYHPIYFDDSVLCKSFLFITKKKNHLFRLLANFKDNFHSYAESSPSV